jgi:membrane associated rhomboid family serine protease
VKKGITGDNGLQFPDFLFFPIFTANIQIRTQLIPLRDTIPSRSFPVVNWILIVINIVIFVAEVFVFDSSQAEAMIYKYGLVPDNVRLAGVNSLYELRIQVFRPFFTNMFLHGGWGHLIANMWILFIFGDNVEDRMGKLRYFIFYILCGLIASFTHFILHRNSPVPAIGASGAISGVMAAYMFMFPKSTIVSFIPIFIIPLFLPIPAIIYIGIWFLGQLLSGTTSLMLSNQATGIAFWAHIGGFLGGLLVYRYFDSPARRDHYR